MEAEGTRTAREVVAALVGERGLANSRVVFATTVGSRCFNLQRDGGASDVDFAGVYAAPPTAFWGLSRPAANLTEGGGGTKGVAAKEAVVDVQVSEVATFANLLLTGNPAAVEVRI
jgi:predicted nucleotidyltransferase